MPDASYRRSTGTPRGDARRAALLAAVTDDLEAHGLVDFSLRRAARAAGATHKVLLYHFSGVEELLTEAVLALRQRRVDRGLAAALAEPRRSLAQRVEVLWPVLTSNESWALDQAIGLAMYDSERYAVLATSASAQYLPTLVALCPDAWSDRRKDEVAQLVLGALRGFLVEHRTSADAAGIEAGMTALLRALRLEEQLDEV